LKAQTDNQAGVVAYQDNKLAEQAERIFTLRVERDQAMAAATPMVNTPASTTTRPAEAREDTLTPPKPTASSRLSERLPDPAIFEGDRKDFRRFQSKIHQKMKTNADRFPTAREKMSYVTNGLDGPAYAQVLPYILDGECQLPDYTDVLRVLERAYGDPNRVSNARKDLFRLKQQNREFASFYAEFQRLALEGEVTEDSQITLLEATLSRELKAQLTSVDAPDGDVHTFAEFLQKLENKRRFYNDLSDSRPVRPVPARAPAVTTTVQTSIPVATDPNAMDLSISRRPRPEY